jgi:hypothetical protein
MWMEWRLNSKILTSPETVLVDYCLMETAPEPGRSKPFAVFEKNVARITLILNAPKAEGEAVIEKLNAQLKKESLVLADVKPLQALLAELRNSLTTRATILTWSVPMLVTFTEAYLQDAFMLLFRSAFSSSTLPGPMVEEVVGKWVKGTMRSGTPHQWTNQLIKFGATGYPEDLGTKLQTIWDLRHKIIHTADPNIYLLKLRSIADIFTIVVGFVRTTDEFLIAKSPGSINAPTTPTSA